MTTISIFILFVPVLTLILLLVNLLLAVHRPDSEKVTPYECGFSPVYGQTRNPFSIQFYLVGILFLVFDLEILLTYPYAVNVYETSHYGFWIVMFFFFVLAVGFVYEFGKGALYFTSAVRLIKLRSNFISTAKSELSITGIITLVLITFSPLCNNITIITTIQ